MPWIDIALVVLFFMIGRKIAKERWKVGEVEAQGSEVGNHSYDHFRLFFKSRERILDQIVRTDEELAESRVSTKLVRPPHGCYGYNLLSVALELEKKVVLWDVNPRDWKMNGSQKASSYIISHARGGSIVDLHEYAEGTGDNLGITQIVDEVVPSLSDRGYQFTTASDLLQI